MPRLEGGVLPEWCHAARSPLPVSCCLSLEGSLDSSPELPPPGWLPPLGECSAGLGGPGVFSLAERHEGRTIGPHVLFLGEPTEPVGGSGVVCELPEVVLEFLEGCRAGRPLGWRKHDGKNLDRVAEFLALDPQPVNVGRRSGRLLGTAEKPFQQRPHPLSAIVGKTDLRRGGGNRLQQPLDPIGPVGRHQPLTNLPDRLPSHVPSLAQHRHQTLPSSGGLGRVRLALVGSWLPLEAIGQHVEVPRISGRPPDPPQPFFEPGPLLARNKVTKSCQGGERPPRGHPQLMHRFRVMPGSAGGRQSTPRGLETLAERACRHAWHRSLSRVAHRPPGRSLHIAARPRNTAHANGQTDRRRTSDHSPMYARARPAASRELTADGRRLQPREPAPRREAAAC